MAGQTKPSFKEQVNEEKVVEKILLSFLFWVLIYTYKGRIIVTVGRNK